MASSGSEKVPQGQGVTAVCVGHLGCSDDASRLAYLEYRNRAQLWFKWDH